MPAAAFICVGAAALSELLESEPEPEPESEPPEPPPFEPPPAAPEELATMTDPEATPPFSTTVVDGPTLIAKDVSAEEALIKIVVSPSGRPAGIVAFGGCDVTTRVGPFAG